MGNEFIHAARSVGVVEYGEVAVMITARGLCRRPSDQTGHGGWVLRRTVSWLLDVEPPVSRVLTITAVVPQSRFSRGGED